MRGAHRLPPRARKEVADEGSAHPIRTLGGLDRDTREALSRTGPVVAEGQDLGIGATFRRMWNGEDHVVTVIDKGFDWNGRTFKSLSAVATAIAGSRWNGPRFFGLRS